MYFYIEPEVSGGLGGNTVADTTVHPPVVSKLNYLFDGWLGDDLLELFPCYVVSERLKSEIMNSELLGFEIDGLEVTKSDQFDELYPGKELPEFYWLKITGQAGKDDFGIASDHRLVVSDKALDALRRCSLEQADLEEF
jgi:hypothetical protein